MVHFPGLPFIPPAASTGAHSIDLMIWGINLVAVFFSVLIVVLLLYLCVKYRRGNKVDRSNPPLYDLPLEIAWTLIPLGIAIGLFVWSSAVYLASKRMPPGAMEIWVTGKQWMWKIQHPEGRWEMDELHVPIGRAVKLTMTSEDVIHSFFVPEFRLHQDVIPGEYTQMWFTPTRVGTYHLYCAQFCGTNHSGMVGTVTVMSPGDFQQWLAEGTYQGSLAQTGKQLFVQHGCFGCHEGGSVRAPRLEGIYGKPVALQIPPPGIDFKAIPVDRGMDILQRTPAITKIADDRYIHDSIILPDTEIVAGYYPVMPSFKGQISESEIVALTAYIKSLSNVNAAGIEAARPTAPTRTLSAAEYKARTGFVPANVPGGAAAAGRRRIAR